MRFPYLFVGGTLLGLAAQAQPSAPTPAPRRPTWAVRWAPLSLIDPRRPTLQLGAEYFLHPAWSLSADVGTRLALPGSFRRPADNYRHQTYRAEARFYLPSGGWVVQHFVGLEGFYVPLRYTSRNNWLTRDQMRYRYDEAQVTHLTRGAALKYGWRTPFGCHDQWWWEVAGGLGWRRKPARYTAIRHEQPIDTTGATLLDEWQLGTRPSDGGYNDRLHLTLSLRVGYQLFRRLPLQRP